MKKFVSSLLLSSLIGIPSAFANGLVLSDGTYYNEPGQSTIFNNSTSITIPTGVTKNVILNLYKHLTTDKRDTFLKEVFSQILQTEDISKETARHNLKNKELIIILNDNALGSYLP